MSVENKLYNKKYNDYLNSKISNNDLTADQINILNETGQLYVTNENDYNQNNYTLSVFEKKTKLYDILKEITNDKYINEIISKLTNDDVEFIYNNSPYIIASLKKKYKTTTPTQFDNFVGAYKIQLVKTNGLLTGESDPLYSILRASQIPAMIKEHLKNRIVASNHFNINEIRRLRKMIDTINLLDEKLINKIKTLPIAKQSEIRDLYSSIASKLPTKENIEEQIKSLEGKDKKTTINILQDIVNALSFNEDIINQIYDIAFSKEKKEYEKQVQGFEDYINRRMQEPPIEEEEQSEPPPPPPVEEEQPPEEIQGEGINSRVSSSLLKECIIEFMKKNNINEPSLKYSSSINKYKQILKDKNMVHKFNNDKDYKYKLNGTLKNNKKKSKPYKRFGKYYINTNKLYGANVLSLRSQNDKAIKGVASSMLISDNIKNIIDKHFKNININYNDIDKLTNYERGLLNNLAFKAGLSEYLQIPSIRKSEIEEDINKFMILRGEIESGNDNIEIINNLKKIILKLSSNGVLPKGESREILLDIISLGF